MSKDEVLEKLKQDLFTGESPVKKAPIRAAVEPTPPTHYRSPSPPKHRREYQAPSPPVGRVFGDATHTSKPPTTVPNLPNIDYTKLLTSIPPELAGQMPAHMPPELVVEAATQPAVHGYVPSVMPVYGYAPRGRPPPRMMSSAPRGDYRGGGRGRGNFRGNFRGGPPRGGFRGGPRGGGYRPR